MYIHPMCVYICKSLANMNLEAPYKGIFKICAGWSLTNGYTTVRELELGRWG